MLAPDFEDDERDPHMLLVYVRDAKEQHHISLHRGMVVKIRDWCNEFLETFPPEP